MSINTATAPATSATAAPFILVARILISILFIFAGFGKLMAISATAGWFGSIGLPLPTVTAIVFGVVELVGGLAILVGFKTRIAAIVLALFTLVATAIAHLDFSDTMQVVMLQKNLGITGGLLLLAYFGAGALSVDRR